MLAVFACATFEHPLAMAQFRYAPPLERLSLVVGFQTVELQDRRTPVARAVWQSLPSVPGGCQLLWAEVTMEHRRRGNGSQVFAEATRQARLHFKSLRQPLRRMMALIPQPNVSGRAWLVRNGFVHVNTLNDLAADGDVLVMLRTFS